MEKQKRWQFILIVAVIVLTLINILPTVFYYTKPLKSEIGETKAQEIALQIIERVNSLEEESRSWLASFSKHLGIQPVSIELAKNDPGIIEILFKNPHDANLFRKYLPRAGSLIPFVPAQLELYPGASEDANKVLVSRQVNIHLEPAEVKEYFDFMKRDQDGNITEKYRQVIYDRASQIALAIGGTSRTAFQLEAALENPADARYNDTIMSLAQSIADMEKTFGADSPVAKRYYASFTQIDNADKQGMIRKFKARIENLKGELAKQIKPLEVEKSKLKEEGRFPDNSSDRKLVHLNRQLQSLEVAGKALTDHLAVFSSGKTPLNAEEIAKELASSEALVDAKEPLQKLPLEKYNPFISSLMIDWGKDQIVLGFHEDVQSIRDSKDRNETEALKRDKLNSYVINEIARVSRISDESIAPFGNDFAIEMTKLTNAQSFLAFDIGFLAKRQVNQTLHHLLASWQPDHADLSRELYPIRNYSLYSTLPVQDQKLGIVVYAPAEYTDEPPQGFRRTSIYVIARGLENIVQKYREAPEAQGAEVLLQDIERLQSLLKRKGFIAYSGSQHGVDKDYSQDIIFELDDFYSTFLNATRENFYVKGSKQFALLDFTDVEQRIVAENDIQDSIHENLLKWRDEYQAAQVSLDPTRKFEVPPPAENVYWQNMKLSAWKYFHGDDRKILRWGLDLSGGKTVRIGLRDQNGRVVTNPEDLKQAVNELYERINKMGVAERTIRIENENIILDFPGSQALSAQDLVKASAMYFHIVNEKFSTSNPQLRDAVNQFLQNVWNEAVVTNRKDAQSINEIAWEHLGGEQNGQLVLARNEYAQILYENGLRLADPSEKTRSSAFNDALSTVAVMRGDDFSAWDGQSHPLMFVFNNYALEGSSLDDVRTGYDPSEGNILSFGVKRAYDGTHGQNASSPREDFYSWTSQFSEDKIAGTPREAYSQGRGWRMAVILNDTIITKPHLRAALRDSGSISGHFSPREISQLAADLKAGSLSFTPRILSEQNVSAELGKEERTRGIMASLVGLFLVAFAMIGYYRFAGLVATCAVLFNLLIMWGVLQNLGAALTLPGIAGIVLTIGMAVDANVLVFERVREEFKISGRIASAIQAGYRKAFSAIVDSNITTILAALILIQFDSGPIKGFAVTLIIGLVSSMFTALFMTRYFFAGWVQNPKNKSLTMAELIKDTKFDFLSYAKPAILISMVVMVIGGYFFYAQKNTLFGMDFTGGYSLAVEIEEKPDAKISYRTKAIEGLMAKGASSTDFEVRELSKPNHLRIQLGLGMEEAGHPFYQMPMIRTDEDFTYKYESDPRIVWVVDALSDAGLEIQQSDLANLDQDWSMMSGQFSETMKGNALKALGLALLSILIYITFRFEFKYAIAAVVALFHDVAITLGILALLRKAGLPVQVDLEVVGAIMTIIGYSLNDTIIVFDRIREDIKILRKLSFPEIINHALNVTLSRTLMTSGTTLLVLIPLVTLGGSSIFDFSLVMTIGVAVGTLSSLFIACPVMLFFHNREKTQEVHLKKA